MATYCNEKSKAILTYTRSNKEKVRYEFTKVPIDVSVTSNGTPGTYRFYGTGDDSIFYQFTASGFNPGYRVNSGFNGRGLTPTMNGIFIKPENYYYVSGSGIETLTAAIQTCQINVTGNGNNLVDTIECPDGGYKVTCGDDCPEGFCKCVTSEYPGYCCLDCNATAAQIRAITNDLRGQNVQ